MPEQDGFDVTIATAEEVSDYLRQIQEKFIEEDPTLDRQMGMILALSTQLAFWKAFYVNSGGDREKLGKHLAWADRRGMQDLKELLAATETEQKVLNLRGTVKS